MTAQRLDPLRTLLLILFGIGLWLAGLFILRSLGSAGLLSDDTTPLIYGLVIVGTIPFVWFVPVLLGLEPTYRQRAASLMAATAVLIDGIVVRWTDWYSADPAIRADCAACLLWAIGVALALGFLLNRDQKPCR